jgi:hypothetical protein
MMSLLWVQVRQELGWGGYWGIWDWRILPF